MLSVCLSSGLLPGVSVQTSVHLCTTQRVAQIVKATSTCVLYN